MSAVKQNNRIANPIVGIITHVGGSQISYHKGQREMKKVIQILYVAVVIVVLGSAVPDAQADISDVGFWDLGPANVNGVSRNGLFAVGAIDNKAVRWHYSGGSWRSEVLESEPSEAFGVSDDGRVVVGRAGTKPMVPFRWVEGAGATKMDLPSGARGGQALATDKDGHEAVGSAYEDVHRAVWWPPVWYLDEPQSLARGISGDGEYAAGWIMNGPGLSQTAVRWDLPSGGTRVVLGPGDIWSEAVAVNDAGWVVGWTGHEGRLWIPEHPLELPLSPLNGHVECDALGISEVYEYQALIVGISSAGDGSTRAVYWESDWGQVYPLENLLGPYVPSGWELLQAHGISGTGKTFIGICGTPDGHRHAFIATVPAPGAALLAAIGLGVAGSLTGAWKKMWRAPRKLIQLL